VEPFLIVIRQENVSSMKQLSEGMFYFWEGFMYIILPTTLFVFYIPVHSY